MLNLLLQGLIALFAVILIAIVISLSFHEFGHAATAKLFGDDTAQKAGRLTLNPAAHIDPVGLLMTALIGFGYARPVPTNPSKFNSLWASFFVSAAGPAMNLLLATIAINFYGLGLANGWSITQGDGAELFFMYFSLINLISTVGAAAPWAAGVTRDQTGSFAPFLLLVAGLMAAMTLLAVFLRRPVAR